MGEAGKKAKNSLHRQNPTTHLRVTCSMGYHLLLCPP